MALSSPASEASKLLEAALEQMDGIIQGAKFDIPQPRSKVSEALRNLHTCLLQDDADGQIANSDAQSIEFIFNWLRNNLMFDPGYLGSKDEIEAERENYLFQMSMLNEQLERQNTRISELEELIAVKKELLQKTQSALERERANKQESAANSQPASNVLILQSEVAQLKNRCFEKEKENLELRRLLGGDRTPKYLPLSPQTHQPPSPLSSTPETEHEESSVRNPRSSFKKIFGKVTRSNSGGQLQEESQNPLRISPKRVIPHSTSNLESQNSLSFKRGGLRATAGGRLGWSSNQQALSRKPFGEWSVEALGVWMESLGLSMYNSDLKKCVHSGDGLAKMTASDLEQKLGIKHFLHRKKLVLAMKARQESVPEAAQGGLDHHWVTRWLDDVGLPQYKDTFFDARVDGRVLNVLTVDDLLCHLKITNMLHHLSIKRGIQVLRHNNFAPDCLKRRAIPGDSEANNVSLWTNHRVMEWLKEVDLSEYAPNLRGSGVHGALILMEPRFTADLLATLLSIPANKTLLRRHLSIHFKELVGKETISAKRLAEQDPNYVALTPTAKAKTKVSGQFTLKRKKSKSQFDYDDLLCPFEGGSVSRQQQQNGK